MGQVLDTQYLSNKMFTKAKKQHDRGKTIDVLPFVSTKRSAIRDHFNNSLGEYVRNVTGITLKKDALKGEDFYVAGGNELSNYIANQVEFDSEDDKYDFTRFIDNYLFNQEDIKPVHPYLYNFSKIEGKQKSEFAKYGQFMCDVLVNGNEDIINLFKNRESSDILTELILKNVDGLKKSEGSNVKNSFEPLQKQLVQLYQEDLLYLSKFRDYFLSSFSLLTHFYVFMYACQLVWKLDEFADVDMEKIMPLYFALDWESISKRRKAADDIQSYRFIKEKANKLFVHVHTISHLSHNFLVNNYEEKTTIPFIPYADLYNLLKDQDKDKEYLNDLNEWIQYYCDWANISKPDKADTIEDGFRSLFRCLDKGMSTAVCEKYGKNIEDLGANQFIKNRGSLGQVLNLKHDFFLLLTAVSVKGKRMPLNELFKEFEKRGVIFDRYSKKEIISLLDNHNILDKKSDSGDAQYVKSIL